MPIKRVVLDVDKAIKRPTLVEVAAVIEQLAFVEGANVLVEDIDMATMGLWVTVEGADLDLDALTAAIESTGAVVNGAFELAVGQRLITGAERRR